jgi:integrase
MSTYKPKGSKRYLYDFKFKGHRYHGSTGLTSKRDADRFEAEVRRKAALGERVRPQRTIEEACDAWFHRKGQHLKSANDCLYQLGNLIRGLGASVPLQDLDLKALDSYIAARRASVSDSSVNREIHLLRRVVRWNAKRDIASPEVDWREATLEEPGSRIRELSEDEERRLFAALPENLRPMVEFALLSGQRKAEIVGLCWSDVNEAAALATLRTKGGHEHTIPLTPRMLAIIREQPKVCPQVFTYVCQRQYPKRPNQPHRIKGERYPFSLRGWSRQWRKALSEAGIENYRFHDNRHTAATRNLRSTGNLRAVQGLLGHKDIRTTTRYAHAQHEDVRAMLFATESRNSPEVPSQDLPQTRRKARDRGA